MDSAPVFIIGTERSGSNLLRLILNTHSAISVPHPPHILKYFHKYEEQYGDLSQHKPKQKLIRDVLKLLSVHIYPWEIRLNPDEIAADMPSADLLGVFLSIYESYRKQSGKKRWGCKSTFMIHHIDGIRAVCPEAKFLFLVRDPRDVAVSSRKSVFSPYHPYLTARLWRQQQLLGLRFYDSPAGKNCLLIRYEDLVHNPEPQVLRICEFLGEEYEPAMLEFYKTKSARKSERLSASWRNSGSPVLRNNTNKFSRALRQKEIRLVEEVTGDLMLRFGYPLVCTDEDTFHFPDNEPRQYVPPRPGRMRMLSYKLDNFSRMGVVELQALVQDANACKYWCRRFFLFSLRLRFLCKTIFATIFCQKIDENKRSYNSRTDTAKSQTH